ncbi:MAG: hypothetical protein LBM98_03880 [Oscillospiraceae bacterium]|nr:hypothetical protein [Oscillospiraceae bacterium]
MRSNPVPGGQHTSYRRILRQPWIASPRFNGTYRKCGGGFAMTVRRRAHHGQGFALPLQDCAGYL